MKEPRMKFKFLVLVALVACSPTKHKQDHPKKLLSQKECERFNRKMERGSGYNNNTCPGCACSCIGGEIICPDCAPCQQVQPDAELPEQR
jgi:hypothetical protein